MQTGSIGGLRKRWSDRVYGGIVARWRTGALDDRAFERSRSPSTSITCRSG